MEKENIMKYQSRITVPESKKPKAGNSDITYYPEVAQGSDEWFDLRRGLLTASEMKLIITPARLQYASNDKERGHVYEIAAQRTTGYTEPSYVSESMMRGRDDEFFARQIYAEKYAPVTEVGFVTRKFATGQIDEGGNHKFMTLGYSPDGLVGDDGLIEIKSRCQKYQMEFIVKGEFPDDHYLQMQSGMLVTGRSWCDYPSYCGGMPMRKIRALADLDMQQKILQAAIIFELKVCESIERYKKNMNEFPDDFTPTERRKELEITL